MFADYRCHPRMGVVGPWGILATLGTVFVLIGVDRFRRLRTWVLRPGFAARDLDPYRWVIAVLMLTVLVLSILYPSG
jgi:hypothetical protein